MSNRNFVRYAARTGRILDWLSLPDVEAVLDLHNTLLYEADPIDGTTFYFVDGQPVARPMMQAAIDKSQIIANGTDAATITGLPTPTRLTITGPIEISDTVTDGQAIITARVPGTYRITAESFPYRTLEILIDAI